MTPRTSSAFAVGDRVRRHGKTATVLAVLTDEESLAYDCDLEVQWDGGSSQPICSDGLERIEPWKAGDPCCACGSTDTYDGPAGAGCRSCKAHDQDDT